VFACVFDGTTETRHALSGRSGPVHYSYIKGFKAGTRYGFRVEGPWVPELGLRFDAAKLLIDPYAWSLDQPFIYHDDLAKRGVDTAALVPKSVAQTPLPDVARVPYRKPQFIYEVPVKAFTKLHRDISSGSQGTVAALAEKSCLDHFNALGIDTIELMPITSWIDERHLQALGLRNAWGYNPVQFFAPDPKLAPGGLTEIRETVAALHNQDIRVILDVVLNHSGESDQFGPTLCMRGLDNATYYAHARGELINDAGCGNTLNLNHPHVVEMVVAALRHWVLKAGVDGFRFDLATVMGRMADGFHNDAPLLTAIQKDAVLSTCILIAEPWDVGPGGYQLGNFPKGWPEWNDKYRDDVRRFWRGENFSANALATRLSGSSDVFASKSPSAGVNFLSAHDGFTLKDIVTYSEKNNLNNGENNRDGKNGELTWVNGDVRALLATLFLSRGTLMLTAGDEFGRTQMGNNNAYAQDNDVTWLNWDKRDQTLIEYVQELSGLRKKLDVFFSNEFLTGKPDKKTNLPDAAWFDVNGAAFDWNNGATHFLGLALTHKNSRIALLFNASNSCQPLRLAARPSYSWQKMFCSKAGDDCPSDSVAVYEERKKP
jgi:glycogen debranching enzyme